MMLFGTDVGEDDAENSYGDRCSGVVVAVVVLKYLFVSTFKARTL